MVAFKRFYHQLGSPRLEIKVLKDYWLSAGVT